MSKLMALFDSAHSRPILFCSVTTVIGHRNPRRSRGDCGKWYCWHPPLHLHVQWSGAEHHDGDVEFPVQSARQQVLQISLRGESSNKRPFLYRGFPAIPGEFPAIVSSAPAHEEMLLLSTCSDTSTIFLIIDLVRSFAFWIMYFCNSYTGLLSFIPLLFSVDLLPVFVMNWVKQAFC